MISLSADIAAKAKQHARDGHRHGKRQDAGEKAKEKFDQLPAGPDGVRAIP